MLKSDKAEENTATATGLNLPTPTDPDEANASSGSPVPVFEVMHEKCPTCIFGSNRPVKPGRLKQHIKKALRADSYAVCHHAQFVWGDARRVACRGFFDVYGNKSLVTRLAQYLGIVQEVELDPQPENNNE